MTALDGFALSLLGLLLHAPIATPEQLADTGWRWFTAGLYLFIFVAYAGVWSHFTAIFDRRSNRLISALFGFLWGSSSGQLFLTVWLVIGRLGMPEWSTWRSTATTRSSSARR